MDYSLNTFLQVYDSIKDSIEKEDNKMPGTMNLIEIMNRHHLENAHSDVIAFLINPDENHKHPEYVNSFIKFVNNKLKEKNQNEIQYNLDEIKFVHREEYTYNKRRIDILIKTETAFIIIENKIGASDQPEQMIDYINDISGRNDEGDKEREIFCIYLTRFEKKISDDSLKEDEKKYIKSFLNLTYSDILDWINTLKTRDDETVLKAALIQYKDVLEGLTKQRLTFDRKFNIIKK
ncbi:MAG: PD-(D/E)XK nuclease family protein [Treponema sp.]|nr:PD-(D/E)XK nuclease family protein [Treponema sp.]